MAANVPTSPAGSEGDASGPPRRGYAVRYERLLMEERSLKESRSKYLSSSSSSSTNDDDDDELRTLEVRGALHRASVGGMITCARHAAREALMAGRNAAREGDSYEAGLERPEAGDALSALWTTKSMQLEEEDNRLPPPRVGSKCLERTERLSARTRSQLQPPLFEADADDFFDAFPEHRRRAAGVYGEVDESESDDDDGVVVVTKKPKAKEKRAERRSDEPVVVTCQSSSPSPELPRDSNAMSAFPASGIHNRSKHVEQPQRNNAGPVGNWANNANQNHASFHQPNNLNNPYQRRNGGHQQSQPQNGDLRRNRQRNDNYNQSHDLYQNEPAFDYDSVASEQNQNANQKTNPFRAASDLPKNFNDNPQGGREAERRNGWDNRGGNNNSSNGGNRNGNGHHIANQRMGGRPAPGGPQNMVRAALNGPSKGNLPGGLGKKYQNPKRGAGGGHPSNSGSGNGNHNQAKPTNNRQAYGDSNNGDGGDEELPEELRGLDKELVEKINNEIVHSGREVTFDEIAGLDFAKDLVKEIVVLPMKMPEMFTGLRASPKGLLLFGPPGTGKTMIGKAIAHECDSTFFSISSSSLTSKWIGEGEKLVRTLFAVARYRAPSVVFIDEVDSLLTQRKADENEANRRIKTEFLVQLDGAGNVDPTKQVLIIGATNLPQELDDAARRRFTKKLYIPLPEQRARASLIRTLLEGNNHNMTEEDVEILARKTDGFSGADLTSLCQDAAMGPIREAGSQAENMKMEDFNPISKKHFKQSLRNTKASVAPSDLDAYIKWNETYGNTNEKKEETDDDTW